MPENNPRRYYSRNIARERRDQYGPRGVIGETSDQRADDLRRHLILKYDIRPENRDKEESEPRNMWAQISDDILLHVGNGPDVLGLDAGTSSGYMPQLLLEKGYEGGILGCDIEASHLKNVAARLHDQHPGANLWFGKANAESLTKVQLINGEWLTIAPNTFNFATVLNVLHHTADQEAILNSVAQAVKPNGLVFFMGRAKGHLGNMFGLGKEIGDHFHANAPRPFYEDSDMFMLEDMLNDSPLFEIVEARPPAEYVQAEYLWIPDTEEGHADYMETFYTLLPLMRSKVNGQQLKRKHVQPLLENLMHDGYFKNHASYVNGFFTEYLFQRYFMCRVIK
jgi:SAM-dependent methyltransferase